MKHHYHIKFHGKEDYAAFQKFLVTHRIDVGHIIITNCDASEPIYDILTDLTTDELIMVFLTVSVIKCIPVEKLQDIRMVSIGESNEAIS